VQKYTEIDENKTLRESRELLLNNDKTAISCNSGPAFPTINLQPGMLCFRTDEQKLYQLNADGATWVELFNLSGNKGLVSRATTADNALKANGHTVNSDVPVNAKFTDTTYGTVTDSASGLMTAAQKKKLDELSNYSLPVASATTLGGVKIGDGLTITNGILSSGVTGGNATHGEKLFTANDTFVVPEGVSTLVVTAVGGGGGGGGGGSNAGAAGMHGEALDFVPLIVTPLSSHSIHIGGGGGGGGAGGSNGGGGSGGASNLSSGSIGSHGLIGSLKGFYGGGGGGGGGASGIDNVILARGGGGGSGGIVSFSGSGSNHPAYGGAGGIGGSVTGPIVINTFSKYLSTTYGAAGGGGGGGGTNEGGSNGGNGNSGCIHIKW
jgi:hypothetical protein